MKNITIDWRKAWLIAIVFIASACVQVLALNAFLIPNNVFSSGFNGIAQLLAIFFAQVFHMNVQTGVFIMIFNIPIGIIGWKLIGGKFTILSFLNSIFVSFLQILAPTQALTTEPLLASLFGGLLLGVQLGWPCVMAFRPAGWTLLPWSFKSVRESQSAP